MKSNYRLLLTGTPL